MKSFFHPTWFRIALLFVILFSVAMVSGTYQEKWELENQRMAIENNLKLPKSDVAKLTTFYVRNDNSVVRKCASLSCEIVGGYNRGETFEFLTTSGTWLELPEWIPFSVEGNASTTLYIHKSNLSETAISQ